ncbi:MAG TPA: hypothetical protein VIJ57_14975 [Hanamia sp.]
MKSLGIKILLFLLVFNNSHQIVPTQKGQSTVVEDFENVKKPAYAADNINGKLGNWYLDDALVASSELDVKNGHKCLRIRNEGKVRMCFDLLGPCLLTAKTAVYGHDAPSIWSVYISYDSGVNYQQIGQSITTNNKQLITVKFSITKKSKFRIEFRKESGGKNRINLDDILFHGNEDFFDQQDLFSKAQTGSHESIKTARSQYDDNGNLLFGNPDNAKHDSQIFNHYLIDAKYYTISYCREKFEANWVSWLLVPLTRFS